MADTLEQIAEDLLEQITSCICGRADVGHWCENCQRHRSLILSALQSLARERDDLLTDRANWRHASEKWQERAEKAEHALATLRSRQEPEKENADGLREGSTVLPPKPEATPIDNGNPYVFCDYVTAYPHRGCVRGAGHNGAHVVMLPPYPLGPVEVLGVDGGAVGDAREETKPVTP